MVSCHSARPSEVWYNLIHFTFIELHPLALEDVFHTRSQNRSKADYYSKHLFLRVLCHQLSEHDELDESSAHGSTMTGEPRSASPLPMEEEEETGSEEFNEKDEDGTLHGSGPNSRQSNTRKKKRLPFLHKTEKDLEAMMGPDSSRSSLTKLMKAEGAVSLYM